MQITQYSICNNYKLSMATFDNIHHVQVQLYGSPINVCTRVEQLFMPLDLGHTCHGLISQMTSWLNCSQNILHPNFHPYDIL